MLSIIFTLSPEFFIFFFLKVFRLFHFFVGGCVTAAPFGPEDKKPEQVSPPPTYATVSK